MIGSGLNTAFLFYLCAALSIGVHAAARDVARKEYRALSRGVGLLFLITVLPALHGLWQGLAGHEPGRIKPD